MSYLGLNPAAAKEAVDKYNAAQKAINPQHKDVDVADYLKNNEALIDSMEAALKNQKPSDAEAIQAVRRDLKAVKTKFKQYKEKYPKKQKLLENKETSEKLNTAFVSDEFKRVIEKGLGAGTIYSTSDASKDDRERISLGIHAKEVVSNKFNSFEAENVIVVDLNDSDQYFGKLQLELITNGSVSTTKEIPFLRGVTLFAPMLPPPADKRFRDYLDDIRRFGIGNENTSIHQALGQSNQRNYITLYQAAISQCFYVVDSFFNIERQKSTVSKPRIVMFYKNFLSTDDAWKNTVFGGNEVYNSVGICPSRECIEKTMKTYLSSPTVGKRFGDADKSLMLTEGFQRAFQNLQLAEESYDLIRHILASNFIRLITTIAEIYMLQQSWEYNATIGTLAGFPAGLIMPQHINQMGSGVSAAAIVDADFPKDIATGDNSCFVDAMNQIRRATSTCVLFDPKATSRRLFKDGTEWINCQTNCAYELAHATTTNDAKAVKAFKDADGKCITNLITNQAKLNSFPQYWSVSDTSALNKLTTGQTAEIGAVCDANKKLLDNIHESVQANMDPNDAMIFQTWGLKANEQILRPRQIERSIIVGDGKKETFGKKPDHKNAKGVFGAKTYYESGAGATLSRNNLSGYLFK